ncbi:MAG TPA: DNA alkylation repair protein [Phototrophicaceae bacterium]|nr:DNA alkylation repair protein [Phototrophicaceae bacterium]
MPEPFKNMFNDALFAIMTSAFRAVYPTFPTETFMERIHDDQWEARELKDRMRHTTTVLRSVLPDDYRTTLRILRRAAPALSGFGAMVFPDFVEVYGLDDWEASIPALEQFTQLCSSEFAVRPFIVRDQERMMAQMLAWSRHPNAQVRRLSSEGCRPRLPWAIALPALKADPSPILPILENLKSDESEFVRRSVANNLNDIAKDNPQVVVAVLRQWQPAASPERAWIIKHALRTLVKAGHIEALDLLGFDDGAEVTVKNLKLNTACIHMGDTLRFSFEVESLSAEPQNLVIDYVLYFKKANGSMAPKVFKLAQKQINPGETLYLEKGYRFEPMTTRKFYAGEHALSLKINGQEYEDQRFKLELE